MEAHVRTYVSETEKKIMKLMEEKRVFGWDVRYEVDVITIESWRTKKIYTADEI